MKIGNFSENKQIFKSERHVLLFHAHLQFSITVQHGMVLYRLPTKVTGGISFSFVHFLFHFYAWPMRFFDVDLCILLIIVFFRRSISYFYKVR